MSQMPVETVGRLIAGALVDFIGYLTTRKNPITVGSAYESPIVLEALIDWANDRGLSLNGAEVISWNKQLQQARQTTAKYTNKDDLLIDLAQIFERHGLTRTADLPAFILAAFARSNIEMFIATMNEARSFASKDVGSPMTMQAMAPREERDPNG